MAMTGFSKDDLRQAMRDPRRWDSWHPEREAYGAWVWEAWKTLDETGALEGDGTTVVQVKGYHRTRNGRREWVGPYEQTRKAAEAENDNAALVPVRDDAPVPPELPDVAGNGGSAVVATVFVGARVTASTGTSATIRGSPPQGASSTISLVLGWPTSHGTISRES